MRVPVHFPSHYDQWIDQENAIYPNRFFQQFYNPPLSKRIQYFMLTSFRGLFYFLKATVKNTLLLGKKNPYKTLSPISHRAGLIVGFHGLNGQPSVWNALTAQYKKQNKEERPIDLFTPPLPKKGHCHLDDETIKPIFDPIKAWIQCNPGKPVVIHGQSMGSRFSTNLEYCLRTECPNTPVYFSLTGGVLYGTSLVNKIAKKIPPNILEKCTFGLMSKKICEELSLGSASSKQLLKKLREPFASHVAPRVYRFYATPGDSHVKEYSSSLPQLSQNNNIQEKHYFFLGYDHNSLVECDTKRRVSEIWTWMTPYMHTQTNS